VLDYEYWSDFLFREEAVCTPAELHGALSALVCVRHQNWQKTALTVLDLPEPSETMSEALAAFYELIKTAIDDEQYGFKMLLPDDALPIAERNRALADWCRGYLLGFGSLGETTIKKVDEQGQEAIRDLVKVAQLDTQVEENDENESALFEVMEYVRIAVLALYAQLNEKPKDTEQLH